jgi:hypothetical protein
MCTTGIQAFDTLNFDKVLEVHNIVGQRYNYEGYPELHNLYKINQIFSKSPYGEIVDRSGNTAYPFKLHTRCPWQGPIQSMSLEEVCEQTVIDLTSTHPAPYYVFWSGGIDSHLALISLLKIVDHKDIVVVCNQFSINEAPIFYHNHILGKLKTFDSQQQLPNGCTLITGELGDIVWGILDDSFINDPDVRKYLYRPWQEYFELKNKNSDFLSYADQFMQSSGKSIDTLLEARWWFYFLAKSQSKAIQKILKLDWLASKSKIVHFYENTYFDTWSYNNTDKFIVGYDWKTYKMPAKELIYKYDKDEDYLKNKIKQYSASLEAVKLANIDNFSFNQPLFITDTYDCPVMPSEPFFSKNLYKELYYEKYKHLFIQ